ncbi:hypothetical protein [Arenibacterium sp. LLYu02]|uniref:hypothetical protein n=1 Tax=Arenibacterium sp. LLYu02 TaxID=3404132 RepID=UPI003B2100C9
MTDTVDTSKEAVVADAIEACENMARWAANCRTKSIRPIWEAHIQKTQRFI